MNRWCGTVAALLLTVTAVAAQTPISHGKPTEKIVVQYEKLVEEGSFLSPDGWRAAGRLYAQVDTFPANGEIYLMNAGGAVGEDWVRGDNAQVETKWTDYLGTIDSGLRYKAPTYKFKVRPTMTVYAFRLVYTNKRREVGKGGKTVKEVEGPWGWKIDAPRMARWTTVNRALQYVAMMRDKTDDPVIKKNADKTIAALKRLQVGCGNASAC